MYIFVHYGCMFLCIVSVGRATETIQPTPKSPDAVPWNRSYGTIGLVGSLALAHTVLLILGAFLKVVYIVNIHFYGCIQELDVSNRLYTVLLCVT